MLITQNGETEEEEKAPDYLAMHAYPNLKGASKVLEDKNALVKSVYTNEQNYMLYLELPASEYLNQMKVLNLVSSLNLVSTDLSFVVTTSELLFVGSLKVVEAFEVSHFVCL